MKRFPVINSLLVSISIISLLFFSLPLGIYAATPQTCTGKYANGVIQPINPGCPSGFTCNYTGEIPATGTQTGTCVATQTPQSCTGKFVNGVVQPVTSCPSGYTCKYTAETPQRISVGTCVGATLTTGQTCTPGSLSAAQCAPGLSCNTDPNTNQHICGACIQTGKTSETQGQQCCDASLAPLNIVDQLGCIANYACYANNVLPEGAICANTKSITTHFCSTVAVDSQWVGQCDTGLVCADDTGILAAGVKKCQKDPGTIPPPIFTPFDWCKKSGASFSCDTALGQIATDPVGFVRALFTVILGIVGMVSVGVIIYSGLLLLTSQGNAEKMEGAKETITAAIVGLIFVIFSMVILQTIGVDILHLPGLK